MIGVFDSGVGGLVCCKELRRLLPKADILYLADRRNAPYGTKSKEQLIKLVKSDINRLRKLGADSILIACCTASTIYQFLSKDEQKIVSPIITPTVELIAKEAKKIRRAYRVTVIATERTVASHAFKNSINNYLQKAEVTELPQQKLVSIVEKGCRDGKIDTDTEFYLNELTENIKETKPDALILGCTHFSHLRGEFEKRLSGIMTLSPAHIGARKIYNEYKDKASTHSLGRCLYTQ